LQLIFFTILALLVLWHCGVDWFICVRWLCERFA